MPVIIIPFNKPVPTVCKLTCDKLFLTFPIEDKYHKTVISNLLNGGGVGKPCIRYKHSIKLPIHKSEHTNINDDKTGESHVLIQCDPRNQSANFLRLECNPSKIYMPILESIIDSISPIKYVDLILTARVNRCDLAVNIEHADIDSLYFNVSKSQYSEIKMKYGKSIYLGTSDSPTQFVFYDKKAEIKHKNSKKEKFIKEIVPKFAITRSEIRLMPKKKKSLLDLLEFSNPFNRVTIWKFPEKLFEVSDFWVFFLCVAKYEGLHSAMAKLSPARKKEFNKHFGHLQPDFWMPDEIWKELPNVIAEILNPSNPESAMCFEGGCFDQLISA